MVSPIIKAVTATARLIANAEPLERVSSLYGYFIELSLQKNPLFATGIMLLSNKIENMTLPRKLPMAKVVGRRTFAFHMFIFNIANGVIIKLLSFAV